MNKKELNINIHDNICQIHKNLWSVENFKHKYKQNNDFSKIDTIEIPNYLESLHITSKITFYYLSSNIFIVHNFPSSFSVTVGRKIKFESNFKFLICIKYICIKIYVCTYLGSNLFAFSLL